MSKKFSIILAKDKNNGIGLVDQNMNYSMPWKFSCDLKYFKNITTSITFDNDINCVIMGKNTWLSLSQKTLPGRINIIISTTLKDKNDDRLKKYGPDCEYKIQDKNNDYLLFSTFDEALEYVSKIIYYRNIFVIGGEKLIKSCLNHKLLQYIYITDIDNIYNCNIFIDNISNYCSTLVSQSIKEENNVKLIFNKYTSVQNDRIHPEYQYLDLLEKIKNTGNYHKTRNANTWSLFGSTLSFDINTYGFPILTTKKVALRLVFEELKFFLQGYTDAKKLSAKKVNIWNQNTSREFLDSVGLKHYKVGDMGAIYGFNLLHFGAEYKNCDSDYTNKGINQLEYVLHLLKNDPFSRRILMTTLDRNVVDKAVLWPCHGICIQFSCTEDVINKKRLLNCIMYQRSCDTICGLPFNISSYGLLMYIICNLINSDSNYTDFKYTPGVLNIYLGDVHIYDESTHLNAIKEHLNRVPFKFPTLKINKNINNINDLEWEDIELCNYISHSTISVNMVA